MATDEITDHDLADLTELWSVAAQAYLDGDLPRYAALANHAPDYTLTPPNGGHPRTGFDRSDQAVAWTANNPDGRHPLGGGTHGDTTRGFAQQKSRTNAATTRA